MEQSESTIHLDEGAKKLPKNLKTLGILSLIMGGLMILGSLLNIQKYYFPTESDLQQKQETMEQMSKLSPESVDAIMVMEEGKGIDGIIGLITQIVSVIGVVLMLKLKKNGFYIYIAGEVLPYILNIAVKGVSGMAAISALGGPMKMIGIIGFVLMIILDIVFIVLYSKQTKYMS